MTRRQTANESKLQSSNESEYVGLRIGTEFTAGPVTGKGRMHQEAQKCLRVSKKTEQKSFFGFSKLPVSGFSEVE